MKQRAQAAMEFLMTYGWAILVVLAAIGALAYFGVLSPDQFVNERCTLGSDFQCNNELVQGSDITMSFVNTQTETVQVYNVSFSGDCTATMTYNQANGTITSREETPARTQTCAETLTAGDLVEIDMAVVYQRGSESINRTATGEFLARVQP